MGSVARIYEKANVRRPYVFPRVRRNGAGLSHRRFGARRAISALLAVRMSRTVSLMVGSTAAYYPAGQADVRVQ
ncbi:MAG: hypothetical protein LC749_19080 [Actinobacteria bacterium]|nr:hypothetical protein [Actinomycetota bacterium]